MTRRIRLTITFGMLAVAVGAVALWWRNDRQRTSGVPSSGELSVTWRGRFSGQAILSATLNWCPGERLGLLQGISSDTGVAILLYETAALTRGAHAAFAADIQQDVPRPGAAAAIRWVLDSATIVGFRALSGQVNLTDVAETATGTLDLRMQVLGGSDTLLVRGQFDRVPVTATAVGCN